MSYSYQKNEPDGVKKWFYRIPDLLNAIRFLKAAQDEDEFEVWFEKAQLIDNRSLYLYIKKHREEFNPAYIEMIKDRLPGPL